MAPPVHGAWRARLLDEPRPRAPRKITDERIEGVLLLFTVQAHGTIFVLDFLPRDSGFLPKVRATSTGLVSAPDTKMIDTAVCRRAGLV